MVHQDSNKLRLAALKNKKIHNSEQTDTIRKALSVTAVNNIVRFNNSDEDSEKDGKQSDILYDVGEGTDVLFADKPHFFGKKGEKLMTLQTKIGSDNRFQLDDRFQSESDSEEETEEGAEKRELESERRSQHLIMNSILEDLGMKVYKPVPLDYHRIVDHYVRFDPTDIQHEKYVLNTTPSSETKINSISETEKFSESKSDHTKNSVHISTNPSQSNNIPIVDKQTFFEIKTDFNKSISENTSGSGGFKFDFSIGNLKTDQSAKYNYDAAEIETLQIKELQYDSSDNEETIECDTAKQSSPNQPIFFFYSLNPKFKEESAVNFKRTKTMDDIEREWLSQRQQLTAEYKKRHKDALRFQKKLISKS